MPKRKKMPKIPPIPDYEGIGRNPEKAYIQKSRPLRSLSETELTLPELKILDAYLARINSHDQNKRTVKLEKGELEQYLGVSRILKDDLNKRLRHLFQVIEVKDENKRKGFKLINLFEEADAEQDENGLWQVTLTCTPSAREYVFNIDNIGYLRYRLKNVINLTSRYSYVLFLYLVDNRFRKSWTISLAELRALLNCTAERYSQFKFFNAEILKKCHKEVTEKTDLRFSYKPVKKGRKVAEIEFTVETVADELPDIDEPQLPLIAPDQSEDERWGGNLEFLSDACHNEFSPTQMNELIQILVTMYLPPHERGIWIARYHYLAEKYARLNTEAEKRKIPHRFSYLKKIILSDRDEQERATV